MKISLNWIKDFVNLDGISIKDIWYRFTMSTAEVDDVAEMGKDIRNVVVGKVVSVQLHPTSAKLKICMVDAGEGMIQCVCGAPNVREGVLAPFAKEGGSIKKISEVKKVVVSGVDSCGILCSASEIGISDNHEGILILDGNYKPGTDIKSIIAMDDVIIEIDNKSLTNRPDLWGHYGIAREMAAIFRRKLKPLEVAENLENSNLPYLNIKIEDTRKCYRYTGLQIDNIKTRISPLNMQVRLYYCGMRPISLIVDLTNYLMLETGQPMHAFDKRQIDGIVVKSTDKPMKFKTLDGVERNIPENVLMICNHEKPVAIAGIMGGENSEVSGDTSGIILESANFEGASLRKNSTKLGLRTEASARFEKMLDPNLTALSVKRFVKLLKDVQKDVVISSDMTDIYTEPLKPIQITIGKPYIDKYIGNSISPEEIVSILKSLEFGIVHEGDTFTIDVPSFRSTKDITMKADIIEEISRIHGYDNIVPKTIEVALQPLDYNETRLADHRIRELLSDKFAFSEVNSYVWYNSTFNSSIGISQRGNVRLLNPHANDMDTLRDSMVPTMLEFAEVNRKAYDEFSIYEIGGVFNAPDIKSKCEEHKNLCALMGSKIKDEDSLFYNLKGITTAILGNLKNIEPEYTAMKQPDIETSPWIHPVKSVEVRFGKRCLGYIFAVHPQIKQQLDRKLNLAFVELNLAEVHAITQKQVKFTEPSKYPGVTLDYSFLTDKAVWFDRVKADIGNYASSILTGFEFVGIYSGKGLPEGKKSMTFRFTIGSRERTLASEDINDFTGNFLKYMEEKGYTLR
ncbi:MAG: phenylalanine--tRNA ligase subunit beta [Ruminiclostridium sp.]|nr:phenylalanine--tRNA ligase subunit beta [Ruminiclostridium sp.]